VADVIPLKIDAGQTARFNSTDAVLNAAGFKVTSTKGLGAVFEKSQGASNQLWPAGVYTEVVAVTPATGYQSITPARWVVPARGAGAASGVHGTVRFYLSDGSTVDRTNTSNLAVTETRDAISIGKDGLTITSVGFGATNTTGGDLTTTIGPWSLDGSQV